MPLTSIAGIPYMTLTELLAGLQAERYDFEDVQAYIQARYDYSPTAFDNGLGDDRARNAAGQNEGSCRLFAFASLEGLDEQDTLRCFGRHYRHVLADPDGQDHANIRQFMRHGWAGIRFDGTALRAHEG